MRIVFLHPDLGIGGAERLVVDAALALKSRGHRINFITAHHDKGHCFDETKDGTFSVTVAGDWIPRHFLGRFNALFAYLRMMYLAFYLVTMCTLKPDVIFCDQISACIPILKLGSKAKILFYCHFPDQLLTAKDSKLKRLYRLPIDYLEEKSTGMADMLLVNSHFTAGIFKETFKSLKHLETHVLYPSLNTRAFDKGKNHYGKYTLMHSFPSSVSCIFLSINRFERKKNLKLAVLALAELRKIITLQEWETVHLIMAGGYDERVKENVSHYMELKKLIEKLNLSEKVSLHKSVSSATKMALFKVATAIIYTPSNEHFGIVPVESMYMEKPVIAMNSGGPLETIEDNKTGILCEEDKKAVADAMAKFVRDPELARIFGAAGKERVMKNFSFENFTRSLNGIITSIGCRPVLSRAITHHLDG